MSGQALSLATKEIKERVRSQFGLNEQSMKEAVQILRDWLDLQPHLPPQEPDDERLERWIIRCKNSLEKAKKSIDLYFTVKSMTPELMCNWDTKSQWFKTATSTCYAYPLPELNENDERIIFFGLQNNDAAQYNVDHLFKLTLMSHEVRMCEEYCTSDIYVMDLSNFTLSHVPKVSLPDLRKYEVCVMGGFSVRLKAMYIVNAPPHAEALIGMIKLIVKSKIASRIHVYGKDLTSFYDQIPRKVIPLELGGEAGTIAENMDRWKQKLESYHNWFLEHEHLKSDEKKRPSGAIASSDLFGFEGSFRKLTVD
ncbi:clavesin-2-like [Periplaneta americana]|uniref:clavesin-2-like n=1 Tax=Periplaneta americana TaxID=6978 RepID=UPI0037E881A0